jgi:hypothetical protein
VSAHKQEDKNSKMRFSPALSVVLFSARDVLQKGLKLAQVDAHRKSAKWQLQQFHAHYGSDPIDLANIWYDLTMTDIAKAKLSAKEKSENGFRMFMISNFFLWTYPKSSKITASRFKIYEGYCRGETLWKWVGKIAALKEKKIVWDARLDSVDSEVFIVTVDGTDFRMWEKKHNLLPMDKGYCSHKYRHCAVKYEIAVSIFKSKCVWISGPHRGGKHDITIFREGLKDKIKQGKKLPVDRGYKSSKLDEGMLSPPCALDSKELNNFKSRARLRQETFNGRLKFFDALGQTFRHGIDKHKLVLEAVCVIVQYQMDNGRPLFAV